MLRNFLESNHSLSEEVMEQLRIIFNTNNPQMSARPLKDLISFMHSLKIQIPQTMLVDYNNSMQSIPSPKFTFQQFTHYYSRATLEDECQSQIKNLFDNMDTKNLGIINAQDLLHFVQQLEGGQKITEIQLDQWMIEMDQLQLGFLTYEDLVYILLPK